MNIDDEIIAAVTRMESGEDPVTVLREMSPDARKRVVVGLSRRGIDVVGGVPMRRPGASLEMHDASGDGRVPSRGTQDEQAARHSRADTMKVNGWMQIRR